MSEFPTNTFYRKNNRQRVIDHFEKIDIMEQAHTAHPGPYHLGYTKTRRKVAEKYIWNGMSQDILEFVRNCAQCKQWRNAKLCANPRDQVPVLQRNDSPLHLNASGCERQIVTNEIDRIFIMDEAHQGQPLPDSSPEDHIHLGIKETRNKVSEKYIWLGMYRDVEHFVNTCLHCREIRRRKLSFNSEEVVKSQ